MLFGVGGVAGGRSVCGSSASVALGARQAVNIEIGGVGGRANLRGALKFGVLVRERERLMQCNSHELSGMTR